MTDKRIPLYNKIMTGHLRRPIEWELGDIVGRIDESGAGIVSVTFLDIDRFSAIEDEYGYDTADGLLKTVNQYLETTASQVEHISLARRYVRDAFIIIYDGMTFEDAFFETETMRRGLSSKTWEIKTQHGEAATLQVVFSAGVATYPGFPEDSASLIGLAEDACLRAFQEKGGDSTAMARPENMKPKTSHYFPSQLRRLKDLQTKLGRSEAAILREALDDLLRKYDQRDIRRREFYDQEDLSFEENEEVT